MASTGQFLERESNYYFFYLRTNPAMAVLHHKIIAFCINQAGVSSLVLLLIERVRWFKSSVLDHDADDGARGDDADDIAPTRKALSTLSMATLPMRSSAGAGVSSSSKGKTVAGSKKKSSGEQNNYLIIASKTKFVES